MIAFKSSFKNTNAVVPEPKIFFWIAVSVADAANSNGFKTM